MVRYAFATAAAAVMLVAAGCGPSDGPSAAGPPSATEPEESVNDSPTPGPPGRPGQPRGTAADAVADLARRLGAEPAQIGVVSVEEVTWRDGSLGCPRPGMMYAQVLTNGTRVVLEFDGRRYEYHSGGRRSAFLCDEPEPPAR